MNLQIIIFNEWREEQVVQEEFSEWEKRMKKVFLLAFEQVNIIKKMNSTVSSSMEHIIYSKYIRYLIVNVIHASNGWLNKICRRFVCFYILIYFASVFKWIDLSITLQDTFLCVYINSLNFEIFRTIPISVNCLTNERILSKKFYNGAAMLCHIFNKKKG